jgi:signal transduction histidine kinase
MNNLDSAYYYIRLVYPNMYITTNLPAPAFHVMGNIEAKRGNVKEALKNYQQAIEEGLKVNELRVVGAVYNSVASLYKKINQADSAMSYAKQGLLLAQKLSLQNRILTAANLLAQLYEPVDVTQALQYRKIADAAKDSLYGAEKVEKLQAMALQEQDRKHVVEEEKLRLQNRIRVYALLGVVSVFIMIAVILFRNSRIKQKAYALLGKQKAETERQKAKAEQALADLKLTQAQLIQSEKMASLGELTAGIAHEIQNPLNFINNFSDVNTELIEELEQEADKGNIDEVKSIAHDIKDNEQKINHHGKRADAIVKGMLQHSRASTGKKEPTDINALANEYLRLSYHGLRAKDKEFNADFKTSFDESIGKIEVVPQDIGRVLLNLYTNAFYAVSEKKKLHPEGYEPIVSVTTKKDNDKVFIKVRDNGSGIPQKVLDKIYQPFFTTKPTGQGTGLGLSLSYDIIKAHRGEIKVETTEGEGAAFVIQLPNR